KVTEKHVHDVVSHGMIMYTREQIQLIMIVGTQIVSRVLRTYFPRNHPVLKLHPHVNHLERVGVRPEKWTFCSNYIDRYHEKKCNHIWNPTTKYIFQTPDWTEAQFDIALLETNHRQGNDKEYLGILNKVKVGEVDE